jgi:tRNA (guanine10-N2)-dimethyltransferase
MGKFFFILSGEVENMPASECISILESNNIEHSIDIIDNRLILLESKTDPCQIISSQAALTHSCNLYLTHCSPHREVILDTIRKINFNLFIKRSENFAVRIKRLGVPKDPNITLRLEREIGKVIEQQTRIPVSLKNPKKLIQGIVTTRSFYLGVRSELVDRSQFELRRPPKRAFFHPSSMHPRLARTMVNLARGSPNKVFLDPFCGTGGLLLEADQIGCRVVGSELNHRILRGARKNLSKDNMLLLADARAIPVIGVESIATDPPYGHSSSTMGTTVRKLVNSFLENASSILIKNGYLCLALPKGSLSTLKDIAELKLVEVHDYYVHKSLTRQIILFQRV